MAAACMWLVLLAVICSVMSGNQQQQQKCPSALPYSGCVCSEDSFQVRCNASANFSVGVPDDLPDAQRLKIDGVNMEVLSSVPYPNLVSLHLTNNNIRVLRNSVFAELSNLHTLILTDNPIGEVQLESFRGLDNVNFINMENSRMYVIPAFTFGGKYLRQLEILRLGNAMLYDIEPHAFHLLHCLALLNISHNYLRAVPDFASADSLLNLTHLDLSHNHISRINRDQFQYLRKLQFLFLTNNRLQQVGVHAFHGLDNTIVSIDLAFNLINSTAATAFIGLTRLQSMYINDNKLTGMIWEELPWDNLINLVLHDNPWDCTCRNSWLVEAELIAIHNNNSHFLCDSPAAVSGHRVLSVPESTFACPRRSSQHQHTTVLVCVGAALSLVAAALGALLLCRCIRSKQQKRRLEGAGGSTPTSAYKRVHEDQGELILRT